MRSVHYVVVFVVRKIGDQEYQLLLGRRHAAKYMGGTWQLISGGIEESEIAWHAALRELREETGMSPCEFYRLSTLTSFYRPDNDTINIAPMFCAIVDEEAVVSINPEHSDFEWVPIESAPQRLMWPGDREALNELTTVVLGNGLAKDYMRIPIDTATIPD